MKKSISLVVCMFLLVLSFSFVAYGAEPIKIKVAHASSEEATTQIVCEAFAKKASELLNKRVNIEIYPNATLGSEAEMVEALRMGTLEAGTFGRHSAIDSKLDVLNLPFLFRDDAHVEKVLRGIEGKSIREFLYNTILSHGIVTLGWYETGFREITSNMEIRKLSDLNGLLIRTPSSQTLVQSFKAWGAAPTAVDLSELYTSLQSKVVDAQENPCQLIYTNNLFEVQKYLCVTNHLTIPNQLVFSKKVWDSYPSDIQEALIEAGKYACEVGGNHNIKLNNSLLENLGTKMQVTYMEKESINEMKKIAMDSVWKQFISDKDGTADLVSQIEAIK